MNILSLCLVGGKITPHYKKSVSHDCTLFTQLEEWGHNVNYEFSSEPYYIVVHFNHNNFWRKDTSPETQVLLDRLKKDIQSKHAILVIIKFDSFGVIISDNTLGWIKSSADFFNIPVSDIIYADAGYNIENGLRTHGIKGLWIDWFQNYLVPDSSITETMRQSIINRQPRLKKFLYLGGISLHRSHRLEFINNAIERCNFKEDAYYSNAPGKYYNHNTGSMVHVPSSILDLPQLDHPTAKMLNIHSATIIPGFHAESYVNIVANTYFSYDPGRLEINEKVHKPMHCLQPFINVGEVGTLKALRNLGYQTFGQWFNESYDSMIDDEERMEAVLLEVARIGQMSNTELNDMLVDMLPVLEHNCALVTERYHSNQGFHDFVAKLEAYRNLIISG